MSKKLNQQIPSHPQIKQQLARILSNSHFINAPRISDFLKYVVNETLEDRAGRIKGFSIASEVFGRTDCEEADTTTIVRVEAGRLRRHLKDYYQEDGQDDPVSIEIPKGGYVPIFEYTENFIEKNTATPLPVANKKTQSVSDKQHSKNTNPLKTKYLFSSLLAMLVVIIFFWWFYSLTEDKHLLTDGLTQLNTSENQSIMVLPFENHIGSSGDILAKGLTEDIITDLSRFSGLDVIALTSILALKESMSDYMEVARKLDVKYIVHGSLRKDAQSDTIRISTQLYDSSNDNQLWANRFDQNLSDSHIIQNELLTKIIQGLSESLPQIIHQTKSKLPVANRKAFELYKQAMSLLNPPADSWRMLAARRAFERVIELDPNWAGGYAGVAYTYAFNVWWGHSQEPEKELRLAYELANTALELDSTFGMANSSLAFAHFSKREFEKALSYSMLAVKSQPSDPYVLAYHGYILCANGDAESGLLFAQRALRIDPAYSRTPFLNILGLINFHAGQPARALELFERNIKRGGPSNPGIQAYQAAALASLDKIEEARNIFQLIELQSQEFDYKKWLKRSFKEEKHANEVINQLQKLNNQQ